MQTNQKNLIKLIDINVTMVYILYRKTKKEKNVKAIEKKITKFGTGAHIVVDNRMLFGSELEIGDEINIRCRKNKITITKKVRD